MCVKKKKKEWKKHTHKHQHIDKVRVEQTKI